jgi:hypothetical protein
LQPTEIPGYPGYFLDTNGNVLRQAGDSLLPVPINDTGEYSRVSLGPRYGRKKEHIHVLMAVTFLGLDRKLHGISQNSLQVDHLNDDKKDNRLENLEVVTRRENQHRARKNGKYANVHGGNSRGTPKYTLRRFSSREVAEIRRLREEDKLPYRMIASIYDVDHKVIYRMIRKETYQKP